MMIEKEVQRRGNKLSDTQKERLTTLSVELMESHAAARDLMERAIRGEDVDAELDTAVKKLKEAERRMETFTNAAIERGWGEIGAMLIQGNLLTPMSQITNVVANLFNAALMLPRDIVALPVEKTLNLFGYDSPVKRNYSVNAYMYGLRKFGAGFVKSLEAVVTGQEKDVTEWRVQRGFAQLDLCSLRSARVQSCHLALTESKVLARELSCSFRVRLAFQRKPCSDSSVWVTLHSEEV